MEKNYSVLFIGNSYTYFNDMPTSLFAPLAASASLDVTVDSITKGGYTLSQFADPKDAYGAAVEAALSGEKRYDFVILQEQSLRPAHTNTPSFYEAVRCLCTRIRAVGATPILYATWGRERGHSALATYGWTNESMTWRLASAYDAIGRAEGVAVAHVGLAFYDVYTAHTHIGLYNPDMTHPSYAGSYLAAATLLSRIFGIDPCGLSFTGALSPEDASLLRDAAYRAVFETPAIPREYERTV